MKPTTIFTDENIRRVRAMRALGATMPVMAVAIGAKSAGSFRARCCQLKVWKKPVVVELPAEVVADEAEQQAVRAHHDQQADVIEHA